MVPPSATQPPQISTLHREAFDVCVAKVRRNIRDLYLNPASWAFAADGDYTKWKEGFHEIGNWTSSFFTGMAILGWRDTGDESFLGDLEKLLPIYQEKLASHSSETMHDIGFLYSLYSVALHKLTGDTRHRALAIRAAETLAARFIPEGNYIRAWGRMDEPATEYPGLAIIDCMMNLPLLHWASRETRDRRFRDIAIRHTDTTLRHFIRADDSLYHSFRFDPQTGAPMGGDNYCGRAIESQWARGTAWAMYGFALAHRHTGDPSYLDAALRVTRNFLSQLEDGEGEIIPIWDFRLLPGEPPLRDSSAAAVAICAIQELQSQGLDEETILHAKDAMLARLCSPAYLDKEPACRGILKHGQVGNGVGKARAAYTSWGDYYFMEALARELGQPVTWW
ncbi:MAG: glycosyl hydrolase [Verrucomicrobiaceae bacterium]|nr:MAG: glycosyl hydrolase [Verrucomicrobiaceae bacterium]